MVIPESYVSKRSTLDFREVSYDVGGIELYGLNDLESAQLGYSIHPNGSSLVGNDPGDWQAHWIVVGHDTACGDPLFLSTQSPHPVFTAMHGQGEWVPKSVAPSIEAFWDCLTAFRRFAAGRGSPVEAAANSPSQEEVDEFLEEIFRFCDGDLDSAAFWAVEAGIDLTETASDGAE